MKERASKRSQPPSSTLGSDSASSPRTLPPSNSAVQEQLRNGGVGSEVAGALEACFGSGLAGIDLSRNSKAAARSVGADAYTIGNSIDMGGHDLQGADLHAMELLGHEISHALANGGSGEELLSRRDDPGEKTAEAAGRRFRAYAERGFEGPAPGLGAAHGGRAAIHRFESAEHADAVDGAADRLREMGNPGLASLADSTGGLMDPTEKITLGNGVEVTPGEITALMGDFYGVFNEQGEFDVDGSFEQLWNGDVGEAEALLETLRREQAGHEISHTAWEDALEGRDEQSISWTDAGGTRHEAPQQGMLAMAKRNDSHFSGPTMTGTDNNMGTYTAFHQRALEAAALGEPDLDRVRALEACGMHYLTDRHAGGHAFDKSGVMDASGYRADGSVSNAFVKEVHDELNASGPVATNARGEHFRTYGDGHWEDEGNSANRLMTAFSVATSFAEVQEVLEGRATPSTIAQNGYGAHRTVPAFNPSLQQQAEAGATDRDAVGVGSRMATQYGPPLAVEAAQEHAIEPAQEAERAFNREWSAWEQWLIDGGVF